MWLPSSSPLRQLSLPSTDTFEKLKPFLRLVSELVLFDLPATQTSVSDAYYEEIRPLSQVSSEGPFEFRISRQNSIDYLDLKNSQIHLKVRVVKGDGSALTAEKVGLAIFFFKLCSVLQNKTSITCNYNP